jgi:hypothetical protein
MKQTGDYSAVIGELVAGRWHDPHTGARQTISLIRDRFSMLDVAADSGQLEIFAQTCN